MCIMSMFRCRFFCSTRDIFSQARRRTIGALVVRALLRYHGNAAVVCGFYALLDRVKFKQINNYQNIIDVTMSPYRLTKLPPLLPQQTYRARRDLFNGNGEITADGELKLQLTEGSCIYTGTQRKPQFLLYLENYLDKELHALNPNQPKYQKVKLQVYREAFCAFIKEFKTYQVFLSDIKNEYENTLAYQDDQLQEMETLRSLLRHATEEGNSKIQACREKEQAEITTLKKENEKLLNIIQTQITNEKNTQTVVNRLQSELSNLYLQYRDECDARRLLIYQLNDLTPCTVKNEQSQKNSKETIDPVALQLSLKVCRKDLTKTQEELTKFKAEYWDVVPRRDWEALEKTQNQTLQQLKTLQDDFDVMKTEFDTLLENYKNGSLQMEAQHVTGKVEEVLPIANETNTHHSQSIILENDMLPAHRVRKDQTASSSVKSEEVNTPVASVLDSFEITNE
uniref:Translin-associated factor X-interacting protein 1 N-terminal domain-containing protein n=1 Tax=Neogobius melanostomus TaxID=47308 RepID=A0A8C6SMU5_9GOBI